VKFGLLGGHLAALGVVALCRRKKKFGGLFGFFFWGGGGAVGPGYFQENTSLPIGECRLVEPGESLLMGN